MTAPPGFGPGENPNHIRTYPYQALTHTLFTGPGWRAATVHRKLYASLTVLYFHKFRTYLLSCAKV